MPNARKWWQVLKIQVNIKQQQQQNSHDLNEKFVEIEQNCVRQTIWIDIIDNNDTSPMKFLIFIFMKCSKRSEW